MIGLTRDLILLVGRLFMAGVFVYDGFVLLHNGSTAGFQYVERYGLPGWLWWFALALELGGGALVVLGFFTRWVALVFFVFCMMTAFFFQNAFTIATAIDFSKAGNAIAFGKDIALAGGFLFLIVTGAGALSLDKAIRGK